MLLFRHINIAPLLSSLLLTSLAVVLRILSNPVANVFQKSLSGKGQHPLLVNFITYAGLSLICIFFSFRIPWEQFTAAFYLYAVLVGLAGALGNGFLVKALQKGDLSVLGPINAYKSVVGVITGIFLLGEIPSVWGLLGISFIIWGSYFVLDTTAEKFSWALLRKKEIQYRIWAMVLTAIEAVFIKKVILASSASIAFVCWCWFGALFSFFLLPLYKVPVTKTIALIRQQHLLHYVLLIVCIGLMQLTTNYVLDALPVGYALSLFQLSTIVSVLLGYKVFQEKDIRKKLLGAAIMLIGSVMIIITK